METELTRLELETALRQFAAGGLSGNVNDWPQLRPCLRYAVAEIDLLHTALQRCEQQKDALARLLKAIQGG